MHFFERRRLGLRGLPILLEGGQISPDGSRLNWSDLPEFQPHPLRGKQTAPPRDRNMRLYYLAPQMGRLTVACGSDRWLLPHPVTGCKFYN